MARVTQVRGQRLLRIADDARRAHDEALAAEATACDHLQRQRRLVDNARGMFARDPACAQAAIWLSHTTTRMHAGADALVDAQGDVTIAETDRDDANRACARHQIRDDRVAQFHRAELRSERLAAEAREELDQPARPGRPA